MRVEILGADSFGVRSLATFVETSSYRLLIDPGVSVCPKRFGLPPHRVELEALRNVRQSIQEKANAAQTVIITHFHHDHYSAFERRPLDLTDKETARELYAGRTIYAKSWEDHLNPAQKKRAREFVRSLGRAPIIADGKEFGSITFSPPFKHGERDSKQGWVVMVLVSEGSERLIFGSDIQLIENESVDWILSHKPTIVIVSGPPIYLGVLSDRTIEKAKENLLRIVRGVQTVVVDHHLLRTEGYCEFLSPALEQAEALGHRVLTASEFMGRENSLLEARRKRFWEEERRG